VLSVFCLAAALTVYWLFNTRLGVEIRYIGSSVSAGLLTLKRRKFLAHIGLAMGNGLVGLGGAVEANKNGSFNQNMGVGVLLIGLSVLILGESIIKTRAKRDNLYVGESILAILIGVLVYTAGIQILLNLGIARLDVKLTATALLLVLLAFAARKHPNTGRLF
jgi:putative ABC transport system permease protein